MPSTTNYQTQVIDCFERLVHRCADESLQGAGRSGVSFRERTFRKVIDDLRTHFGDDQPLTHVAQLKGRAGYGKGTLRRITEILATGTLEELATPATAETPTPAAAMESAQLAVLRDLQSITGVGPAKARELAQVGATREKLQTWSDEGTLDSHGVRLTHHQRLGLRYYEDLRHRIPRTVIETFDAWLRTTVHLARQATLPTCATICGSYRRGNPDSGDIDVLLTRDDWDTDQRVAEGLRDFLETLHKRRWLADDLTARESVSKKYMGFLRVPNHPWALRIDIRAVQRSQYAPALAYFTGSKEENVRLRGVALRQNMQLNEYRLCRDTAEGEETMSVPTEEALYAALNEPYKLPTTR